jgi:alkaline phosphatase D
VGTSITSGSGGHDRPSPVLALNPHPKFFNSRCGYVRVNLTRSHWRADFRVVPFVSRPGAPIETRATWVVEAGRPGVQTG